LDAEPDDLPDIRDDPRWVRCAVYTRQSVTPPDDDPAVSSCAIQRDLFSAPSSFAARPGWYPVAERFDDEGESGATLERPGLAKLLRRIEEGDVKRVMVYRVDRLTRKLADLARLAAFFERHRVGLTIVFGNIDADAGSLAGLQVNMLATFAEIASPPDGAPATVKERMLLIAKVWQDLWPRTKRLAVDELFESIAWHRKPSGNQGRKGNGPRDRSQGPLLEGAGSRFRDSA
jgi:hypothetical protein